MIWRPPRLPRTDTPCPSTTLFRATRQGLFAQLRELISHRQQARVLRDSAGLRLLLRFGRHRLRWRFWLVLLRRWRLGGLLRRLLAFFRFGLRLFNLIGDRCFRQDADVALLNGVATAALQATQLDQRNDDAEDDE